jgi:hypothetical protein
MVRRQRVDFDFGDRFTGNIHEERGRNVIVSRGQAVRRGPMLMQFLNGRLMAVLIDEDTKNRALEGVLGFQMHVGPPFKLEFRNIWYRKL